MAINRPDIYRHNNPNLAISDSDFVRGGFRSPVNNLSELYLLSNKIGTESAPGQLKEKSTIIYVNNEGAYYILKDISNVSNENGWEVFSSGGGIGSVGDGLTIINDKISLGGNLSTNVEINVSGQTFQFSDISEFQISNGDNSTIFGVDDSGFILVSSGGTITLDDTGGLKYGDDYSENYSGLSIPDVNFVTGLTNTYLKLDQSTSQEILNGSPIFGEGFKLGITPQINAHDVGKMYYDENYKTVSVDIGDETTLQIGQENLILVYNNSGSIILNGSVVYSNGVYGGGGLNVISIGLSIATGVTESNVLGITTQDINNNEYGYVTIRGNINKLDTLNSDEYSDINIGDTLYLSSTEFGKVTNIPPESPSLVIHLGRILTKDDVNGKIYVDIHPSLRLNDILNVNVGNPNLDNVLKWNGNEWVDAPISTASGSVGINFYYSTPLINSVNSPAGLNSDGSGGNGIQVSTLSKIPVTSGSSLTVTGLSVSDVRAFSAWVSPTDIIRTTIDAGVWEFYDYVTVDDNSDDTYLIHGIYQVTNISDNSILVTGVDINLRIVTINTNQFSGLYFNYDVVNTDASFIQLDSGIYQIVDYLNDNEIVISVPNGYVNEVSAGGSVWNKLFNGSTTSIENELSPKLYQTKIVAPSFTVNLTDKIGQIMFVSAGANREITLSYNGSNNVSFFKSPLVTLHNELSGLQGGVGGERYHLNASQVSVVSNTSGVNTGDETKSTIEEKLVGEINSHSHSYNDLSNKPDLDEYNTKSEFNFYTGNTSSIINNSISGITNNGNGVDIVNQINDNVIDFSSLVGSGGTTIQKIDNDIIINTDSNDILYVGESPAVVGLGGIDAGYVLTGKSLTCIIQDLFVPELFQTSVGVPTTTIAATLSGVREIGCSFIQTISPTYSGGNISPLYNSTSPFTRGGAANAYCYSGPSMGSEYVADTYCTINPYVVTSGIQNWGVVTRYDEGSCIKGSKGTVNPSYSNVCEANSETNIASISINGILPWYWGVNDSSLILNNEITGGTKIVSTVSNSTSIIFNAVNEYLWLAVPSGTSPKTKWWVCAANAGDIGGVGNLWADSCPVVVDSGQNCWSGCSFDVYVTCDVTSTANGVAMCLYR